MIVVFKFINIDFVGAAVSLIGAGVGITEIGLFLSLFGILISGAFVVANIVVGCVYVLWLTSPMAYFDKHAIEIKTLLARKLRLPPRLIFSYNALIFLGAVVCYFSFSPGATLASIWSLFQVLIGLDLFFILLSLDLDRQKTLGENVSINFKKWLAELLHRSVQQDKSPLLKNLTRICSRVWQRCRCWVRIFIGFSVIYILILTNLQIGIYCSGRQNLRLLDDDALRLFFKLTLECGIFYWEASNFIFLERFLKEQKILELAVVKALKRRNNARAVYSGVAGLTPLEVFAERSGYQARRRNALIIGLPPIVFPLDSLVGSLRSYLHLIYVLDYTLSVLLGFTIGAVSTIVFYVWSQIRILSNHEYGILKLYNEFLCYALEKEIEELCFRLAAGYADNTPLKIPVSRDKGPVKIAK